MGIKADDKYFEYRKSKGYSKNCFFTLYRCHNIHYVAYSAIFAGRYNDAI
jgi:hypothetical protein